MSRFTTAWRWLRVKIRDRRAQLRLCLRVTVAAIASFVLAQFLTVPLAGLWAVLTAVVVTQMSVGGSLQAVLALAIAPLALLAAVNPHFRAGPFTAVIVVLGTTITHTDPVGSALYRVLEVTLGGVIGVVVSLLVLPARAYGLAVEAAAGMLDLL